jgi:hypothetical protein
MKNWDQSFMQSGNEAAAAARSNFISGLAAMGCAVSIR